MRAADQVRRRLMSTRDFSWADNPVIRSLTPSQAGILEGFLYEAIFVPEGERRPPRDIIRVPEYYAYIDGFGRDEADMGVAAHYNGQIIGVAWARIMYSHEQVGNVTPAVAVSVLPSYRGRGLGTRLLNELLERIHAAGFEAASVSIHRANKAIHMYRRLGFRVVQDNGYEYVMVRTL